jgi:crotonobetainyl-CoA:carnitine CoA-transferase CaiB-like acyl-CoA transferase
MNMHSTLLRGLNVVELGSRVAVDVCGRLLRDAGATVTRIDAQPLSASEIAAAAGAADLVITSSDTAAHAHHAAVEQAARASGKTIVCDITAGGRIGPYSRYPYSDFEVQALTGLMDTTGFADGPPTAIGLPFCEISAGIYAAVAASAAIRSRRTRGVVQDIDVTLFDCATSALSTFLPHVFAGRNPRRLGNRHSSAAPWNAYRTSDGWILLCTSTQEQWNRLACLIGASEAADPCFSTPQGRVDHVERLDQLIEAWSSGLTTAECLGDCSHADIPVGPIVTMNEVPHEPNVRFRAAVDAATAGAGEPAAWRANAPFRAVVPDTTNHEVRPPAAGAGVLASDAPFKGMRVIEIGQYTTAPLVGKHLAALGAEIIKIEPPGGDVTRQWPHGQGDTSYFFVLSNADKKSVVLDLKTAEGKLQFEHLLKGADVLVENLRPGALDRLGFGSAALSVLNPRLVYCPISGFGARSAYPERPAFDTVIQAMSGFMDLTRAEGKPAKAGISAADILSGQIALFAVVAALLRRDDVPRGIHLDISMQDCAVWASQAAWRQGSQASPRAMLACADGYVAASAGMDQVVDALGAHSPLASTRSEAIARLARSAIHAVPVQSVAELTQDPHFRTRGLGLGRDAAGCFWPTLPTPYRFSFTSGPAGRVIGAPGADNAALLPAPGSGPGQANSLS